MPNAESGVFAILFGGGGGVGEGRGREGRGGRVGREGRERLVVPVLDFKEELLRTLTIF